MKQIFLAVNFWWICAATRRYVAASGRRSSMLTALQPKNGASN